MSLVFNPYSVNTLDLRDVEEICGFLYPMNNLFIIQWKCLQFFQSNCVFMNSTTSVTMLPGFSSELSLLLMDPSIICTFSVPQLYDQPRRIIIRSDL